MLDENGETVVTGVYTHDSKTGRLFGINDFTGWVMYSDDDGLTWKKYNKESINKWQSSPYLEDLSYDSKNDKLYVAWGWTQLSVITDNGNKVTNITDNIPKMLQFEGAPTKEQIGSNYCERRIRTVAVDPNNPDIIYAGGGSYTYQGDSSLYRSSDGGKTWKVVSINGTNSIVSTKNGDYGGVEPISINVKPDTGELWASGNCTGLSKLTPPYFIKQNNSSENNENKDNVNTDENEDKNSHTQNSKEDSNNNLEAAENKNSTTQNSKSENNLENNENKDYNTYDNQKNEINNIQYNNSDVNNIEKKDDEKREDITNTNEEKDASNNTSQAICKSNIIVYVIIILCVISSSFYIITKEKRHNI